MRKFLAGAALALMVAGAGGTAFAGEVGGDGHVIQPIEVRRVASSICAFNGLDDGSESGLPVTPGVVQSFGFLLAGMAREAGGASSFAHIIHDEGPGTACRGNAGGEP